MGIVLCERAEEGGINLLTMAVFITVPGIVCLTGALKTGKINKALIGPLTLLLGLFRKYLLFVKFKIKYIVSIYIFVAFANFYAASFKLSIPAKAHKTVKHHMKQLHSHKRDREKATQIFTVKSGISDIFSNFQMITQQLGCILPPARHK